ncbi:hypothetical protein H7K06_12735 [Priestia aryabhattai]|uniref:hypothetical protein n=1 Tax=Priestia aryabhattai TaxID=412384 RepID=UPI001C8E5472|nr:hypothetical protein [Priestia aryabhattai]MBX9968373.1 hypothetical protein [Priestia aryabhattai]
MFEDFLSAELENYIGKVIEIAFVNDFGAQEYILLAVSGDLITVREVSPYGNSSDPVVISLQVIDYIRLPQTA